MVHKYHSPLHPGRVAVRVWACRPHCGVKWASDYDDVSVVCVAQTAVSIDAFCMNWILCVMDIVSVALVLQRLALVLSTLLIINQCHLLMCSSLTNVIYACAVGLCRTSHYRKSLLQTPPTRHGYRYGCQVRKRDLHSFTHSPFVLYSGNTPLAAVNTRNRYGACRWKLCCCSSACFFMLDPLHAPCMTADQLVAANALLSAIEVQIRSLTSCGRPSLWSHVA